VAYFLGILLLWLILFVPLGLAAHAVVLGAGARLQAAVIAPVSGLAIGVIGLGIFDQLGLHPGHSVVLGCVLGAAVVAAVAVWRRAGSWRSRALLWAAAAVVTLAVAVQAAVFETPTSGPLGYGAATDPIAQIATIDTLVGGASTVDPAVRMAAGDIEDRPLGFERLAAFTVAMGADSGAARNDWVAYTLHAVIMGLVTVLMALPLLLLARVRRLGALGTMAVLACGVTSPIALVAVGRSRGELLASALFVVTAVVATVLTRRDRGWGALAALHAGAAITVGGIPVLLPIGVAAAVMWQSRHRISEHRSEDDEPVSRVRLLSFGAVIGVASMVAAGAGAAVFAGSDASPLHLSVGDAVRAWPVTWLGPGGDLAVPRGGADIALLILGGAVMALVMWIIAGFRLYREMALFAASFVLLGAGLVWHGVDPSSGLALVSVGWMVAFPLLAVIIVSVYRQMHERREEAAGSSRWSSVGPGALLVLLLIFSVAASVTSGSRFVHGPGWGAGTGLGRDTLLAVDDPWLAYLVRGTVVDAPGPVIDADLLTQPRNPWIDASIVYERPPQIVVGASPFQSDPPGGYEERANIVGASAVRVFVDESRGERARRGSADAAPGPVAPPRRHDPVERGVEPDLRGGVSGEAVGGLVVPGTEFRSCGTQAQGSCVVPDPATVGRCSAADVEAVRLAAQRSGSLGRVNEPLLGVGCWTVELDDATRTLQVHTRDIGVVIPAFSAKLNEDAQWQRERGAIGSSILGGDWLTTSTRGAAATYGDKRLFGTFDVSLESRQVADIELATASGPDAIATSLQPGIDTWSRVLRSVGIAGALQARNSSGTQLSLGRMVVRPQGQDPACDVYVPAREGSSTLLNQPVASSSSAQLPGDAMSGRDSDVALPALVVVVTKIERATAGAQRVATIAAGNFQQWNNMPRQVMFDWTAQHGADVSGRACFGLESVQPAR
jgi:hypothetical protein